MRILLFLLVFCFAFSCKNSKAPEPTTPVEDIETIDQSETEAASDLSAIATKDFREFKVLDSKNLTKAEIWETINPQMEDFTEADYKRLKSLILEQDMTTLQNTNESLQEQVNYYENLGLWIDYELNSEITDKGLYSLSRVYTYDRMEVIERSFENQSDNFYYEAENIHDFKVSNDNEYIAMMYLDGDNLEEQYMEIYSHDKELLYSYDLNDFNKEVTDGRVGENSIIKFELITNFDYFSPKYI
jgi:hypothetical protein